MVGGIARTFTVQEDKTRCYHFSGKPGNFSINQEYLSALDCAHAFIEYFNDCLVNIKELEQVTEQIFKSVLPLDRKIQIHNINIENLNPKQLSDIPGPLAFMDRAYV